MALIRNIGHFSLSSLHRQMERDYEELCDDLSYPKNHCISRVQLSRILSTINQEELKALTNNYFKKEIKQTDELEWFAIDGKELRGSINKSIGQKRGNNTKIT